MAIEKQLLPEDVDRVEVLNLTSKMYVVHQCDIMKAPRTGNGLHCKQLSSTANREVQSQTRWLLILTQYLEVSQTQTALFTSSATIVKNTGRLQF